MLDYEIRQMYEDMEIRLIQSMKRNLQRHLDEEDETGFKYPQWQAMKLKELKRYQRQNKDIVGHDTKGFSSSISKYLKRELREGSYNAIKQSHEAMGDKYKANKRLSNSFFKINDKKVNALINSVNGDLKTANKAVLRMTNDQYRKVIFQSQLYVANGVMTPAQAIDAANKDFLRRGLNVIEYKDGKRVNIASYSQMAIRTAGQRAMLMGEGAARKKMKQHLIQISAHGTSCELCIPWQGKVLIDDVYSGGSKKDGNYPLVSEAMEQGLFHPNCRHGISTYFGGKDDISDINASFANGKDGSESDAAYIDDMNYINRKIKEYQRLEVGSLDETNVKTYKAKRKEWENKKKTLEKPLKEVVEQPAENVERKYVAAKYVGEDANKMKLWDKIRKNPTEYNEMFPSDDTARSVSNDSDGSSRLGDRILTEIAKEQGFDGLPQKVTKEQMDKLVKDGGIEIFRGLEDKKYCEQFINGDYYSGIGMYGNGNYFVGNNSTQFDFKTGKRETLDGLTLATKYTGGKENGGVIRAVLKPDAKIIDYAVIDNAETGIYYNDKNVDKLLRKEMQKVKNYWGEEELKEVDDEPSKIIRKALQYDGGRWAAYAGYDAIHVRGSNYYIILNRTSVIVEENILEPLKEVIK